MLGAVPAGLPELGWTPVPLPLVVPLLTGAAGLALVSFTSGMVTARSFAARNRYEIDVDREFVALGACNVAAGLSQGFAVTGADSRTAMSDVMGGKTQVTGLVAAAAMVLVLLFFTGPLRYLPGSALGAVLISAGIGLFDWRALVRFYRIQDGEFLVCVAAMLGVVALGALEGIALSIALAMLVLLVRSSRPADAVLGRVEGLHGFHDLARHEGAAIRAWADPVPVHGVGDLLQRSLLQTPRARGRGREPWRHVADRRRRRRSLTSIAPEPTRSPRSWMISPVTASGWRLVERFRKCNGCWSGVARSSALADVVFDVQGGGGGVSAAERQHQR